MVPPGPGSIIWESGGPWDYYLGVSWGKKGSPQFPLKMLRGQVQSPSSTPPAVQKMPNMQSAPATPAAPAVQAQEGLDEAMDTVQTRISRPRPPTSSIL